MTATQSKPNLPRLALVSVFRETIIGGVAVHSSNLYERLVGEGYDVAKVDYATIGQQASVFNKLSTVLSIGGRLLKLRFGGTRLFHFHASNQALIFYLFGPLLALLGARVILSIHSGYGFNNWLDEHPWYDRLNRLALRTLDQIVFMNPQESERTAQRYTFLKGRISTVNPFIAPANEIVRSLPQRQVDPNVFRIVTIGAWGSRYNVEEAVEAAARLAEEVPVRVSITVVQSTSTFEPAYKDQVLGRFDELSDRLIIKVIEDTDAILPLLATHDVFVRPSKGDSYGLCVAEALLVGTPAIATDVCQRCSTALLYRQGDSNRLDSLLQSVYDERELAGEQRSLLSPKEDSFQGYLRVYEQLV